VGTWRKHHEIQKGNYKMEGRLKQPKQKRASGGFQIKDGVHTSNTYRYVIEKKTTTPECPFCGVSLITEHISWECTETTRERRETGTTKEVWTDGTEGLTKRIEYFEENRTIPWNMNKNKDYESQRTTKRRMQMDKNVN
jgi:ribosomal protein L37AE/L43A